MKYIKLFEQYNNILNHTLDDIVDESDIYQYVESLHHTSDDFIDGDLGNRIEWYPQYKLVEVPLSSLDLDEFYFDDTEVDRFKKMFTESGKYPPIVISHDYSIIDGTHRANALDQLGKESVLAFIGIGNDDSYDPFDVMD
jgi:hypothetical protein